MRETCTVSSFIYNGALYARPNQRLDFKPQLTILFPFRPPHCVWFLVPWPSGIELTPTVLKARSLNHWTSRVITSLSYPFLFGYFKFHLKFMELRFSIPSTEHRKSRSHKAVQKIMGEVDISEMKSQLECREVLRNITTGQGDCEQLFMSWMRDSLWKKKKKKKNSIGRLGITLLWKNLRAMPQVATCRRPRLRVWEDRLCHWRGDSVTK